MTNIKCRRVHFDNIYNYRYIITTFKNNTRTLTVLVPFNNSWFKRGPFLIPNNFFII